MRRKNVLWVWWLANNFHRAWHSGKHLKASEQITESQSKAILALVTKGKKREINVDTPDRMGKRERERKYSIYIE